jgi:general secretion pathway protein G
MNMVAAGLLLAAASSLASMTQYHATYANLRQIDGAVMTFGLEHGRYPTQSEGLALLVTGPPEKPETNSYAYIKEIPKDAWGHDFVYRFPSLHNTNGPDIYSLGEDGISKTGGNDADDINNWNEAFPWIAHYNPPSLFGGLVPWLIGCAIVSVFGFLFWARRNGLLACCGPQTDRKALDN